MTLQEIVTFPELLKEYRRAMRWTQDEIAKQWNYSLETISAWERGKRNPHVQEIPRLAKLLGMELETVARSISANRGKTQVDDGNDVERARVQWARSFDIWGEIQGIYRSRTEFNRDYSYPQLFENATHVLAVGISLNAIALNYSREKIIESILMQKRAYQLCFLDPDGDKCAEREQEEELVEGTIGDLTRINMYHIRAIQNYLRKVNPECVHHLQMRKYNSPPHLNIYIVDDALMTVQHYVYSRGEDTPTLVLKRLSNTGLFDFYANAAKHVLEQSIVVEHGK